MSCNYYIHTRDIDMIFDLGKRVYPIYNDRVFECHLCQVCGCLKPVFEKHSYSTFEELKKILQNKKYDFKIVTEHGTIVKVDEFIKRMEKSNKTNKERFGMPIDKFGYHFLDKDFS